MKHTVYILRCRDKSFYIGYTTNLEKRLLQHNHGNGAKYTRNRRPVEIIYWENYNTRKSALDREKQLKRWTKAKKCALISNSTDLLKSLSKNFSKKIPPKECR